LYLAATLGALSRLCVGLCVGWCARDNTGLPETKAQALRKAWALHAMFLYIELFHNPKRLHWALDYKSPVQFEQEGIQKTSQINSPTFPEKITLASRDVGLSAASLLTIYQKRWNVEEYHKSLKSNAVFAKPPTKLPHTQSNHFFTSLVAFIKLEAYRTSTHLNHFTLKGKLYQQEIYCLRRFNVQVKLPKYEA
jgi:hypothetical protein